MTLLKVGKNRIMTLLGADADNGMFGTSSTAAAESQTGLIAQVTSTLETLTVTTADKQITLTHSLNSLSGNGETYREFANYLDGTSTAFNRVVLAELSKTNAEEFQTSTIINIL